MINLNFENILQEARDFKLAENDTYVHAYPHFLKYFADIERGQINEHHLVIASHFVYGWMPTIISLDLENKDEVLQNLYSQPTIDSFCPKYATTSFKFRLNRMTI